ncbi:NAD-dependent epimerase/dehydratase family protein [Vibrio sp. Of7-15]|uniref:NAD-dependent epimerase/dehydratase family protein n=1 Tax=Vibrio sp. Of7-15 TaxID=2724879 RepID=UPI001EF2822F|nr:NAD-dependent epimerase/dehydratase family protein [Vibrio sp. Of7-15]MCG7496867.1 NAD-dependent epimerase/dehydratase family protein [Vibrio sp. Of7-15]
MESITLVTGASGFVGREVLKCSTLLKPVVRSGKLALFNSAFQIDKLDGKTSWIGAFENVGSIIHLAGLAHSNVYGKLDYQRVNVDGTLHLAREAAKAGVKRFVFVSSIGVNGPSTNAPFSSKSSPSPHNIYAESKYSAELGLKEISRDTGMQLVIIRPTLVYGANAPGNFGLLSNLIKKVPCLPFGIVNNKRNFIAVQNLADLLIVCSKHPDAAGRTFLASDSGGSVSIKTFTNAVAKGLGKNITQLPVPVAVMRFAAKVVGKSTMIEQLVGNLEVDSSCTQEVLGWRAPYTMEQAMSYISVSKK